MKPESARRQLASYPVHVEIIARYSDLDPQEHINNVAVAEFYQESRLVFHQGVDATDRPAGSRTLVAHHEMDYLAEINYPGRVIIGVAVARVGTTSYTLHAGMFQHDRCVGLAATVLVHADAQGPAALTPGMRSYLERHRAPGA